MNMRPRSSLFDPKLQRPSALDSIPRDPGLLWLDKNENLDPALSAVLREMLDSIPDSVLGTYPEAGELYRKLARWAAVSPQSLLLTPGSDGAIRLTYEAFVEPGDGVIHTFPTFAMYPVYSRMFGALTRTIEYRRVGGVPRLDPTEIVEALREHRPKLLCLPNPDSPTGAVLPPDVLREILSACEQSGSVLLLDEAYHPFYDWTAVPWTRDSENLVVARTFAKAWGAAGLRIGYAVGNPSIIALLHKMRPMYEVSTLAVECMSRMIDRSAEMIQSVARIKAGKALFAEAMRMLDFGVLPGEGNFSHVAFGERAGEVHAALAGKVLYRPAADHPCLAGYSRFSIAPAPIMAQVASLIARAADRVS